jgi:hypothetical protein
MSMARWARDVLIRFLCWLDGILANRSGEDEAWWDTVTSSTRNDFGGKNGYNS